MPLALDGQTLTLACGFRKLRTAWAGSLVRVGNESAVQTDIGAVGDDLDRRALDIASPSNGGILTWYDQSGNGRNLTFNEGDYKSLGRDTQIGRRAIQRGAAGFSVAFTGANLFTAAAGTLLWAGNAYGVSTNGAGISNGLIFSSGDIPFGFYAATRGEASTSLIRTAGGWIFDGVDNRNLEATFSLYRPLRLALKWNGTSVFFKVNDGAWQSRAAGNAVLTGSLLMSVNGNSYLNGELVAAATALSDAVIEAWQEEAAIYWGDPPSASSGGSRVIQGAGMIYA
jgi:hypothetical protein